jgi:hypothetical protein
MSAREERRQEAERGKLARRLRAEQRNMAPVYWLNAVAGVKRARDEVAERTAVKSGDDR